MFKIIVIVNNPVNIWFRNKDFDMLVLVAKFASDFAGAILIFKIF
jgi:hypothetical protein